MHNKYKIKILTAIVCGVLCAYGMTDKVRADEIIDNDWTVASETDAEYDELSEAEITEVLGSDITNVVTEESQLIDDAEEQQEAVAVQTAYITETENIIETKKKTDTEKTIETKKKTDAEKIIETKKKADAEKTIETKKKTDAEKITETKKLVEAENTTETKKINETEKIKNIKEADNTEVAASFAEDAPAVQKITVYNGINYGLVYDYDYYIAHNQDVLNAYGGDPKLTIEHFVTHGMNEGRQASEQFDVRSYINAYRDLRTAFGNDTKNYYIHYIYNGYRENRVATEVEELRNPISEMDGVNYSDVYDYDAYTTRYQDIKYYAESQIVPDIAALKHFIDYGMKEGRQAKDSFDVNSYINAYGDLRAAYGNEKKNYYLHYINYGSKENRKATDVTELQNPVVTLDGKNYSDVYDYYWYISHNSDVNRYVQSQAAPDVAALRHFIDYGINEKRQANENFDIKSYINQYSDLRRAYGSDWSKYIEHYSKYGKNEQRNAVGITVLQNPTTAFTGEDRYGNHVVNKDYSLVYDYYYYVEKYSDLKYVYQYDDAGLLKHFVLYGMNERREASENFDVMSYYRSYQDLRTAYRKDYTKYYEHYINYGAEEGRQAVGETVLKNPITSWNGIDFSKVYDYYYYTCHNNDLVSKYGEDDYDILHHYIRWGMAEDRRAKENYDYSDYINLKAEAEKIAKKEEADEEMARRRAANPSAAGVLDKVGWSLTAAYNYAASLSYYGKTLFDASWGSYKLAQYGFDHGCGNCYVMAAVFYELAKMLNVDAHQISGFIPLVNGDECPHSWVEVDYQGGTYVCDPNLTQSRGNDAYMKPYGSKGIWVYQHYYRMN